MIEKKAFKNFKHNGIHLNFPNGNSVSTIWGYSSYSENYDNRGKGSIEAHQTFMSSDTCEVMVLECSNRLLNRLKRRFDGDNPFGYLSIKEWLYIVNAVAKDDERKNKNERK